MNVKVLSFRCLSFRFLYICRHHDNWGFFLVLYNYLQPSQNHKTSQPQIKKMMGELKRASKQLKGIQFICPDSWELFSVTIDGASLLCIQWALLVLLTLLVQGCHEWLVRKALASQPCGPVWQCHPYLTHMSVTAFASKHKSSVSYYRCSQPLFLLLHLNSRYGSVPACSIRGFLHWALQLLWYCNASLLYSNSHWLLQTISMMHFCFGDKSFVFVF